MAGFSSQGGGHTERMLMPLEATIKADRAAEVRARAQDVLRLASFEATGEVSEPGRTAIVLVLPPHWEVDTGNEASKLAKYKEAYTRENVDVVTVQSDKTVLGFYEPHGPSDNFRILDEFASKPQRDNSQVPFFGPQDPQNVQKGQAFTHHAIMEQIVGAAGNKEKITVFEDMDPYLAKAADKAGVPKSQIVGQSNHLLLLDADDHFGGKSDAFLVKVNGNGHLGNVATVAFSAEINTTRPLGTTLDELGVKPEDKAVDVRKKMVQSFLASGRIHNLAHHGEVPISGTVMVGKSADADTIDRGVYLYLNKYTDPLGQHIKERLNGQGTQEQVEAYRRAMFVVCGAKTLNDGVKGNAMHMAQAANFDAVTAAGFGTSSEMHYLISNDAYQGNLVMMPVERQHEQEANAAVLMPAALAAQHKERVSAASDIDDLKAKLDAMVVDNPTTNARLGQTTMSALYTATHREQPKATDKAVERLTTHQGMTADESRLLEENTRRANDPASKALRRLNKLMMPALKALSEGSGRATLQMTAKAGSEAITIPELIKAMKDPAHVSRLTGADFSGEVAKTQLAKSVEMLEEILDVAEGDARKQVANKIMRDRYANNTYTLGY